MPRAVPLRDERVAASATLVVRGAPLDDGSLRVDCDVMARRFLHEGRPLWGFSVEGVTPDWPLGRILQAGRVRSRRAFATCLVGELHQLGAEVLATFGGEPPHYTVQIPTDAVLLQIARLMARRTKPNPNWTP